MDISQPIVDQCFQHLASKGLLERLGTSGKYFVKGKIESSASKPHSACNMEALSVDDHLQGEINQRMSLLQLHGKMYKAILDYKTYVHSKLIANLVICACISLVH